MWKTLYLSCGGNCPPLSRPVIYLLCSPSLPPVSREHQGRSVKNLWMGVDFPMSGAPRPSVISCWFTLSLQHLVKNFSWILLTSLYGGFCLSQENQLLCSVSSWRHLSFLRLWADCSPYNLSSHVGSRKKNMILNIIWISRQCKGGDKVLSTFVHLKWKSESSTCYWWNFKPSPI